ncbi:MAG: hypothetical protein Q8911_01225 [Bacillota bacterium]|nr:hypothetical protein [Bacillota bacterium]
MALFPLSDILTTLVDGISKALRIKGEVSVVGNLNTCVTAPLTGLKTVTATAAEVFAGASAKANRRMLFIKNMDPVLRCKVGASGVSQQTGTSLEPGAAVEIKFDPGVYVPIYAISEGASIKVEVWEV